MARKNWSPAKARSMALLGIALMILLFWWPLLIGMKAAFNVGYTTVPEAYSDWWFNLKEFADQLVKGK